MEAIGSTSYASTSVECSLWDIGLGAVLSRVSVRISAATSTEPISKSLILAPLLHLVLILGPLLEEVDFGILQFKERSFSLIFSNIFLVFLLTSFAGLLW